MQSIAELAIAVQPHRRAAQLSGFSSHEKGVATWIFFVCQRHNYGCPFCVYPTGGHVPQVGVALKYSHLTECGPWAKATVAPSDGYGSYCIIVVRICGGTKLCS